MEPIVVGIDITPEITIDATGRRLPARNGSSSESGGAEGMIVMQPLNMSQLFGTRGQQQQGSAESAATTAATTAAASSSSSSGQSGSSQDSRARAQTQPTTSTRTRLSTQVLTAPHLHLPGIPVAMGGGGQGIPIPLSLGGAMGGQPNNNFDILLPCNSHHIPSSSGARRSRQSAADRQRSASVPPAANRRDQGTSTPSQQSQGGTPTFRRGSPATASPLRQPASGVPAFMAPFVNSFLSGMQGSTRATSGGGGETSMESSIQSLLSGLSNEADSDPGMANAMLRITREIFRASQGETNGTRIADLLESFSDYSYTAGEDMITDLLMCLARALTLTDLIGILSGSNDVMGRVQAPLQTFMRQRMALGTSGAPPTSDEIQEAVSRLLDEAQPAIEASVQEANVAEGVDYAETLNEFLSQRLVGLVTYIWSSSRETFASGFYQVCQVFLADLTNLSVRSFSDGQASLERLARGQLSAINGGVGSTSIRAWTMSSAIGHLRNYLAGMAGDEGAELDALLVKTEDVANRKSARERRMEVRRAKQDDGGAATEDDETFETPRSSPEAMDIAQDEEEAKPETTKAPPPAAAVQEFPSSLMSRSGMGPDMVVGREPWHRSVPAEWVPVIARDAAAVPPPQAPLSDAYLTTVPAKKRRLVASRKHSGSVKEAVETTLSEAVRITGVQPKTSREEAAKSAADNPNVERTLADSSRNAIKRRLEEDADFEPEKFPNCDQFLDKRK